MADRADEQRVWATRPVEQNAQWQAQLQEQGYATVALPLLAIEPVQEPAAVQSVKNLILDFDQFDKVIFVSQNAVREAFEWLLGYWPQLPQGVQYFAVGTKTAACAREQGIEVVGALQSMDTDELLAMEPMQDVWGQKVLICRGQGGLPRMGEVLHERGAIVRYCELYQRKLPDEAVDALKQLMPIGANQIIALFSGETLRNFASVLDASAVEDRTMPIVVPGKRVAQLAHDLGFSCIQTAANASAPQMLEAIRRCAERM